MTLPTSGQITMAQIQTEFGGSNPIGLNEYYRNGSYVTSNNTNVPTSGQITLNNFYGANLQDNWTLVSGPTYSSHRNTSNAQQNLTMPSGIQADDLIIVFQQNRMGSQDGYGQGGPRGFGTGFTSMTGATYNASNSGSNPNPNNVDASFASNTWYSRTSSWYVWGSSTIISFKVAAGNESGATIGGFMGAQSNYGNPTTGRYVYILRPSYSVGSNYEIKIGGSRTSGGQALDSDGPRQLALDQFQIPKNGGSGTWQGEGNQGTMTTPSNGVTVGIALHNSGVDQGSSTPSGMIPSNALSTLVQNYSNHAFPGASPNRTSYMRTVIYTLPNSVNSIPVFKSIYGAQSTVQALITVW